MTSMGGRYRKGSDFERDIVAAFNDRGWVAFRAAGSGRLEKSLPDVVALKGGRVIMVECKATSNDRLSLKPAMLSLTEYAAKAGAKSYIAVRFFRQRPRFYDIFDLMARDSYTINDKDEYLTVDAVIGRRGESKDEF
ncbi:MAG: Holliday junction resolvase Hjc [Candidatus Altiarchaeota archaeon]